MKDSIKFTATRISWSCDVSVNVYGIYQWNITFYNSKYSNKNQVTGIQEFFTKRDSFMHYSPKTK